MRGHIFRPFVVAVLIGASLVATGTAASSQQGIGGSTSAGNPPSGTCVNECAAFQNACQDPIAQETLAKADGVQYSIVDLATYAPDQGTVTWTSGSPTAFIWGFFTPIPGSIGCTRQGSFITFESVNIPLPETARWMYVTSGQPLTWSMKPGNS